MNEPKVIYKVDFEFLEKIITKCSLWFKGQQIKKGDIIVLIDKDVGINAEYKITSIKPKKDEWEIAKLKFKRVCKNK